MSTATTGMPADLLAGLTSAQLEAVTTPGAPLCILAGAGSGKTRVLTRRIAWRLAEGDALAAHVLALTFTRRAADELSSRLAVLGVRDRVAAGTFHAIAYAQLRRRWADTGERPPGLLDRKTRVLARLLPARRSPSDPGPAELAAEIEWAQARMVSSAGYEEAVAAAGRKPPLPAAVVASIYERYQAEKRSRHLVDFDDLLLGCAQALESDPGFAATQRWRFRHLFVDEFQDVNPLQFRLLEAWRDGRDDLCVVGDARQAIYSWNGADPRYLTGFDRRFPGATVVHLDDNHRSSPQVVAVANAVLDGLGGRRQHAVGPDGPLPSVTAYASDAEEVRSVVRALRRRGGPGRWSALAVLARTHAQLVAFEDGLKAAGIPFRLRGASAFLDQPAVRETIAGLRRRPGMPLREALPDLDAAAEDSRHEWGDDERGADLDVLARQAREFLALDPGGPVGGFLAWLTARLAREEPAVSGQAVELATFHAAKGLEWPVVFVVGLEQGLLPIGHATTPEARAEERRLLYVAVTRAERELHCSWAERRTFGSGTMTRSPSPWLVAVEDAIRAIEEAADPGAAADAGRSCVADGRARLRSVAGGRRVSRPGEGADPAVLAALRSWRATTARTTGVPAFVVFHDTTLAAVAEACPHDRSSLLALPGMGPVKAERYGDALLAVVAAAAARDAS